LISYNGFRKNIVSSLGDSRNDVLLQISEAISNIHSSAQIISNLYYYNDTLDTIVNANPNYLDEMTKYNYLIQLKTMSQTYQNALVNIDMPYYCVLRADNGYNYLSLPHKQEYNFEKFDDAMWTEKLSGTDGQMVVALPYKDKINEDQELWCLSFARILKNANGLPAGQLFINVDERVVYKAYEDVINHNSIYLLGEDRIIISSDKEDFIGSRYDLDINLEVDSGVISEVVDIDGEEHLISGYRVKNTGLMIIEHLKTAEIIAPLNTILKNISLMCVVMSAVIIIISLYVTRWLVRPLEVIRNRLLLVSNGALDVSFADDTFYEFQQINHACQYMLTQIDHLIQSVKQEEQKKRAAEIQALQSQINPHFIYNTLFSIKCMVDMQKSEAASNMLVRFCSLLRRLFREKGAFTTIRNELKYLREYEQIMEYRYPDLFTINYSVDPKLYQCHILRFVLQPLIENSIFHGSKYMSAINRIDVVVRAVPEKNQLVLMVSDTGVGMEQETLSHVFDIKSGVSHDHFGLYNVRQRLMLYFDDPDVIEIQSCKENGTKVIIRHPMID